MATYSADQIIGKVLIAKKSVALRRYPSPSGKVGYTASPGASLGTVQTWVHESGPGSPLWWSFLDSNGKPYYVRHEEGAFNLQNLKDQGVITVKEQTEQQKKKVEAESGASSVFPSIPNPFDGFGEGMGKVLATGVTIVAAAWAAKILLFDNKK
jgi:hypothetical protein